jgi:hypothetical protein
MIHLRESDGLGHHAVRPRITVTWEQDMASKLIASQGKVKELRVVELGSRHGPPTDQIDVEVVAELDTVPDRGLGFQLRDDANRPVRQGMLDLLRDAFQLGCQTRIEYSIDLDAGKKNGIILRVILLK